MKSKIIHTPDGVRDWLPDECGVKNKMIEKIENAFVHYGYKKIESPIFEFAEVFDAELTNKPQNQLYTLADEKGDILALRADMTPPIVRIATTAYKNCESVMRFFYSGNVFLNTNHKHLQGKLRESSQTGIELLGINSAEADAEAIEVTVRALESVGLTDFIIHIGHTDFIKGVLRSCCFEHEINARILELMNNMDYVGIVQIVKNMNIDSTLKQILENIPLLVGDFNMLSDYRKKMRDDLSLSAISRLLEIDSALRDLDLQRYVTFDLGIVSHMHYYTGLMFRAYSYGTGYPIASGGRYDSLAEKFGKQMPAVGVTIKVNNLLDIIFRNHISDIPEKVNIFFTYENGEARKIAFKAANQIRQKGYIVENDFVGKSRNIADINLFFNNDGSIVFSDINWGTKKILSYEEIIDMLQGEK